MIYTMLLNVEKIDVPLPHEIIPGHFIDRATGNQRAELRRQLKPYLSAFPVLSMMKSPYEHTGENNKIVPLDRIDYRYFVINHPVVDEKIIELSNACLLLPYTSEIDVGFTIIEIENQIVTMQNILDVLPFFQKQDSDEYGRFCRINIDDLVELRDIYEKLKAHDEKMLSIGSFIQDMQTLKAIDPRSRLQFAGYMGVLEAILTHQPDPKDIHESIGKQIKKKLTLLEHRIKGGFDYGLLNTSMTPDKIWGELYAIRSSIAHGSSSDADSRKIEYQNGLIFIREVAKKVIRHALVEPQLIRDLKEC